MKIHARLSLTVALAAAAAWAAAPAAQAQAQSNPSAQQPAQQQPAQQQTAQQQTAQQQPARQQPGQQQPGQAEGAAPPGPSPVRLDADNMAGLGLTPIPNDGFIDILVEGELVFEIARLYSGDDLQVVVVESTPAKTDHRTRPLEYDEFVLVLNGKLVLTEPDGTVHEFTPGQSLVVPKGYTGTWEQVGTYRELAIIATQRSD